jgi:hypothetical protein
MLVCPQSKAPLKFEEGELVCEKSGLAYAVWDATGASGEKRVRFLGAALCSLRRGTQPALEQIHHQASRRSSCVALKHYCNQRFICVHFQFY